MKPAAPSSPEGSVFLAAMTAENRAALLAHSRVVHKPKGGHLFAQGDPGETLFVIEQGRVEVSVTSLAGRKSVLAILQPGDVLGEIALFDDQGRSADATCLSEAHLRVLSRRDVDTFLRDHPDAVMPLIAELCQRVRNATDMFSLATQTAGKTRLARILLRVGDRLGVETDRGRLVPAEMSQTDLGDLAGLARENVNRQLKAWEKDGWIVQSRDGIVLRDVDALTEIAEL